MSERGLVVHQGSLSNLETALGDATTAITTQINELLEQVETLTPGWDESSESHMAHLGYQQKLRDGVREDAREIEVENVAIVN